MIGSSLENTWGAFGSICISSPGFITCHRCDFAIPVTGRVYLLELPILICLCSLRLRRCIPIMEFLLFFVLPIKVKWLGYTGRRIAAVSIVGEFHRRLSGQYSQRSYRWEFPDVLFCNQKLSAGFPKEISEKKNIKKKCMRPPAVRSINVRSAGVRS